MEPARRIEVVYEVPSDDDHWLLEEEDVPESALHDEIIFLIVQILVAWKQRQARHRAMIRRNFAVRWSEQKPRQGVDPDVCLLDPAPPEGEDATSLCTWKRGHKPPRVAVEIVSEGTADKDYSDGPDRYAASGTRELWIFDPLKCGPGARGGPVVLQVWRRDRAGQFRRTYAGDGPARSHELRAWLVVTDGGRRLRLADDAAGAELWPTAAEIADAEAAKAAKAATAAEAAEAEIARLRSEVASLRAKSK